MTHLGIICPNAPGHLNPVSGLAQELRSRGYRVSFFVLGEPPISITSQGFDVHSLGGSLVTPAQYREGMQKLGTLTGRAALKHTFQLGAMGTHAVLHTGAEVLKQLGVTGLIVDQGSFAGGTLADQLQIPFATVCNALLLHGESTVPPFFTTWPFRDAWWARLRNGIAWAAMNRLYTPILRHVQERRRELGLSIPRSISETWSTRLQICQQPALFDFPRKQLPSSLCYVGPLHHPVATRGDFPWERLSNKPLVYASLGTLQNQLKHVFRAILQGLSSLDVQVVLALGRRDAIWDEPVPANAIVAGYAPQLALIERASVVVTHAGLNTALESLTRGKPMVCIPVTNDQPGVAARVVHIGAGELIPLKRVTPELVRQKVELVLSDERYRTAALTAQAAIQSAGGAKLAADLIAEKFGIS